MIILTLISLYASVFLTYLWWELSEWLADQAIICLLAIVASLLSSLVRRRWKRSAALFATLVIAFLPALGVSGHVDWLCALGFRIHAEPIEHYLAGCQLIEFIEKGAKQTVGECESHGLYHSHTVIYDTSAELRHPVSHRTPEWRRAMSEFFSEEVLDSSEGRTRHIFGNFYDVATRLAEERG